MTNDVVQATSGATLKVLDCRKAAAGRVFAHKVEVTSGTICKGDEMSAVVDEAFRRRTRANHTATHLLQAALRKTLGDEVAQKGSIVREDGLRFDFSLPRPMSKDEVRTVEDDINRWCEVRPRDQHHERSPPPGPCCDLLRREGAEVQEAHVLHTTVMDLEEAKAAGAIAMFDEKYESAVRVVDVPGVSKELCGGTHVSNTAEIGGFKVLSEGGIASGVRRIEAVAGPSLMPYVNAIDSVVQVRRSSRIATAGVAAEQLQARR